MSERKRDSPYSRRLLIEAQILRAGPSLIFMVEIRCSSRRRSRACPSISCDRNWAASSSQPEHSRKDKTTRSAGRRRGAKIIWNGVWCGRRPWSEETNLQTSSTLHWAGVAERKLAPSSGAEQSDWGALCSALEQEREEEDGDREGESSSSSSSPSLDMSSERLDSELHYVEKAQC